MIVSKENDQFIVRQVECVREHSVPQALPQGLEWIGSLLRNIVGPHGWKLGGLFPNKIFSSYLPVPEDLRLSVLRPTEGMRIDDPEKLPAESVLAVFPKGTPVPDEVARIASGGFVIYDLSAETVLVRRISVPAQAKEFLPGIVNNQIERLSPWQADQAVFGFDAEVDSENPTELEVRVFITSRDVLANAQDELKAIGLPINRIVARENLAKSAASVTLWSRLADLPRASVERARRQIGNVVLGIVIVSVVVSLWALWSAASVRGESDDLANHNITLQRHLQGYRSPPMTSLLPVERAWQLKKTSLSTVIVLEVLSRALPDTAYLTELRIDNKVLRITGLADDAPALIAPLERSGYFTDVRFFAPTTRGSDGAMFKFHIEARVVPRLEITEN